MRLTTPPLVRGASHTWFSLHTPFLPLNPHSMAEAVDTEEEEVVVVVVAAVEAAATAEVDPAGARADPLAEPLAAEVAER